MKPQIFLLGIAVLVGCENKENAEILARSKEVGCRNSVVLQVTAKDAGETIDGRLARLAEVQTQCDSEIFSQVLRADEEAAIAWLEKLTDERAAE